MKLTIKSMLISVIVCLVCCLSACNKLVDAGTPVTLTSGASVYNGDATAVAVLTGIYINMDSYLQGGNLSGLSVLAALSADELILYSGSTDISLNAFYTNNLSNQTNILHVWDYFYPTIFTINSAIEGLSASTSLTPVVKQQLLGEAKFLRGLHYSYLINLYGDVPLVLTTDYTVNGHMARTPKDTVWQQVVADLKDAQGLLSDEYLDGSLLNVTTERVRPTKWAATALLARVYLFTGDWADAITQATSVINGSPAYQLTTLDSAFLKNNTEAIWQLQPTISGQNAPDGWLFNLPSSGPGDVNPFFLNPRLVNSFEAGDQRKTSWVNHVTAGGVTYYYPYKYKSATLNAPVTEYEDVFRVAEQYLIRAEANARANHLSEAAADLNVIRNRAGLPPTTASSQGDLLTAILHERQVELFTEFGHRWIDLKRMGAVDSVMTVVTPLKGGTWKSYQQWYPINIMDLKADVNLVQNQGY